MPGSITRSDPDVFEVKGKADTGEGVLELPPVTAPYGRVVVALPEALDLVKYLQGLDHTYPILPPPPQPSQSVAPPTSSTATAS